MGTRYTELANIFVTNTGDHDVLLGTDWLSKHNPNIDWATNTITLNRCPSTLLRSNGLNGATCTIYGLSAAGRLFARLSAYVEEGRMTSGGMTPHRLFKEY